MPKEKKMIGKKIEPAVYVALKDLKPAPWNPRMIEDRRFEQLCDSLKKRPEFMEDRPLLATRKGTIYSGNQRYRVAEKLKWEAIPVKFSDISEKEAVERALIENNHWGQYVEEDLVALLNTHHLDPEEYGFSSKEIDQLLKKLNPEDVVQDEPPPVPKKPKTKLGDLYILGEHRLLCGDATKLDDAKKLMNGQAADMIFTDPPYNVNYEGKTKDALKISNDSFPSPEVFRKFLCDAFLSMAGVSKKGAAAYVCHADSEGMNFRTAFELAGFLLKQCIIWNKNSFVMGRQDYQWKHEPILYGWREGGSHSWYGGRTETTVWDVRRPSASREHPTMKPIELVAKALQNSSKTDDLIIDFFAGSGTTLIACQQLERKCYSIELDPKYCDVIVERWENFTEKKALLNP